ncbi:efflux RND transporter periplasmic adaptor subunit [Flavobacterium sp. NKUCC04_CG]|uniref:efflux RND transporter periplasmic adaptor subunit n=1 Tax=Flavobacterium sp. NKUCC04_CG TaxID=2842121 RepID=UPI001C5AAD6B|nr:efflux RND transporter periplasmic adaptor subunit [Flavobacterium sp. NKUCC04_CG]MBW3519111.1 efflux RND transporter periplasmic adaptor subunit [Flavobacterium sp. NKUCC04_CG]
MKRVIILGLLLLTVGGMIGYRLIQNKNKQEKGPNNGAPTVLNVQGMIVRNSDFNNSIQLSGSIEPNEQVDLKSEVSGVAENIYFQEGTMVKAGQTLLKVNDAELQAQLLQAKTKVALTSENERRAKLLIAKEAISREEYDMAYAELRSAQAQVQLVVAQIQKTSIKAPFSGKIGLRYISPGTYITPSTPIAKLVNSQKVKISFAVPEKYAPQVKNEGKISFSVSGNPKTYSATIYAIETQIEVTNRTLQVRAIADNRDGELIPGSFANIELILDVVEKAILVPTESIIPIQNGKKVFIAKNGKASGVSVTTGTRTKNEILILDGLKVGDTILTSGVMSLKDNTPVKITLTTKK